jgi:2-hydroxychromene-2-carboxylate isomerase
MCWEEGADLTDAGVRTEAARRVGLDTADVEARIAAPEVKSTLRTLTDEALRLGIFGVPTFRAGAEIFWGHDRMDDLAAWLGGARPPIGEAATRMLARPRGVERRRGG